MIIILDPLTYILAFKWNSQMFLLTWETHTLGIPLFVVSEISGTFHIFI